MLALRLPPEIEQRLDALAKKTGRSKSYCAREAILRQIEEPRVAKSPNGSKVTAWFRADTALAGAPLAPG
jgi:predicted transcriptional regulator